MDDVQAGRARVVKKTLIFLAEQSQPSATNNKKSHSFLDSVVGLLSKLRLCTSYVAHAVTRTLKKFQTYYGDRPASLLLSFRLERTYTNQ